MSTKHWVLETNGNTLWHIQKFLTDLYNEIDLDALLVPMRTEEPDSVAVKIVEDTTQFDLVDPFAPLMTINAAKMATQYKQKHPDKKVGVVMRACEIRALIEVAERENLSLDAFTIIGVDCAGTFTEEDFEWRGGVNKLAYEMLQYARQGGIATYRYRPACQMCSTELPEETDVSLHVLGLPARKVVLIKGKDQATADRLHLGTLTDNPATQEVIAQHNRVQKLLKERRERARERIINGLDMEYTMEIDQLIDHLKGCVDCQNSLNACPIYTSETKHVPEEEIFSRKTVARWLTSCAGCGMCEEANEAHLPLAQIFARIQTELDKQPA